MRESWLSLVWEALRYELVHELLRCAGMDYKGGVDCGMIKSSSGGKLQLRPRKRQDRPVLPDYVGVARGLE